MVSIDPILFSSDDSIPVVFVLSLLDSSTAYLASPLPSMLENHPPIVDQADAVVLSVAGVVVLSEVLCDRGNEVAWDDHRVTAQCYVGEKSKCITTLYTF